MKKDSIITILDSARKVICGESNCKDCFLNEDMHIRNTKYNVNMCSALENILNTLEDNFKGGN